MEIPAKHIIAIKRLNEPLFIQMFDVIINETNGNYSCQRNDLIPHEPTIEMHKDYSLHISVYVYDEVILDNLYEFLKQYIFKITNGINNNLWNKFKGEIYYANLQSVY